jgi:hypothetical protein
MSKHSLTLYDFRDIDLMMKLAEEGASGATAPEVAEALGFNSDGTQSVGVRFAWMRKYGMLAFDPVKHIWTVSEGGERVIRAHERAAGIKKIEKVPDEQLVDVVSHVTSRWRLGDPMIADMLRREFMFGTHKATGQRR